MTRAELISEIRKKRSFLCIGLDPDIKKIPQHLLDSEDPVFEFNRQIIDATLEFAVAYKPNTAFYESLGASGWQTLKKTIEYIPGNIFTIADAKRGDIGNTSALYARAFFEELGADSITVAPYMGNDSIKPFLDFKNKWTIVLGLTSNEGADDFELSSMANGDELYKQVLRKVSTWGSADNLMFVCGATRPEMFTEIRKIVPDNFLLVPGVGAQGGDLSEVWKYGRTKDCGLLVNSSRGIIYASSDKDFATAARNEAKKLQEQMQILLNS